MTFTEAICRARKRVRVVHYGNNDFVVHEYAPHLNATRGSGWHMDFRRAQACAREARIRVALDLLGVEDAGTIANVQCQEEGRWEAIVRDNASWSQP